MAYDTSELEEQAIKAIEAENLYFIDEVVSNLPCAVSTFYDHFPKESKGYKRIVSALDGNKIDTKVSMRKKWYASDNATLQVALMKLICSDDEAHRLNGSRTESKIDFDKEDLKKLSVEFINGKDGV